MINNLQVNINNSIVITMESTPSRYSKHFSYTDDSFILFKMHWSYCSLWYVKKKKLKNADLLPDIEYNFWHEEKMTTGRNSVLVV